MSGAPDDRIQEGGGPDAAASDAASEGGAPPTDAASAADAPPAAGASPPAETVETLRDRWLRAEAELQNYRRRAAREREEARRAVEEANLLEMISVLDDLERALAAAAEAGAPETWTQGVRLVANRIGEVLARAGVRAIDPAGERFDPAYHEALLEVEAPAGVAPGSIAQVIHKGYARGDRALRVARVVVAREPSAGGS